MGNKRSPKREDSKLTNMFLVDYAAVTAVVDATHRYKEIFYSE